MSVSTDIWVWIAAFLTLCIYSFLYRDNPFFKLAEHIFIGASVGYSIALTWHLVAIPKIYDPLKRAFASGDPAQIVLAIIPVCLGALMFSRLFPRISWLSLIPMGYMIGLGAGLSLPRGFQAYIFKHIQNTILVTPVSISQVIAFIAVITTLTYFFFSVEHKGPVRYVARVGIYFLMASFGASFGYTVMARLSLLIGRLQFLLKDWLGIIK